MLHTWAITSENTAKRSLKSMISTPESRTERMALKNIPFKTFKTSENDLEKFKASSVVIDPSLPTKIASKNLSKQDLKSCEEYQNFLTMHCNEGEYAFQIRRCLYFFFLMHFFSGTKHPREDNPNLC